MVLPLIMKTERNFKYEKMLKFTQFSNFQLSKFSVFPRPVWLNGCEFVYEISRWGFESSYSHLNFGFCTSFEQGVPWHSGNYRVWIHSKTRSWHDEDIQLKTILIKKKTVQIIL